MITALQLKNFRSYRDDSFEFDQGVNIIVGPNASGKTNLLEAILVGCCGGSYRVRDPELITHDAPWARIDLDTDHGLRTVKLVKNDTVVQKSYVINNVDLKRLVLTKTIPVVLFEPNHLLLLSGSPDKRREYIDNLLEQITPGYATLRRHYKRALAQRNMLLKLGPSKQDQLFVWNIRLSQLGGEIVAARQVVVDYFASKIQELYQQLSGHDIDVTLQYTSSCVIAQYSSDMLFKLERSVDIDYQRGFTNFGPHRDDLKITLGGYLIDEAASRGETRTMLLAIKILEMSLIEERRGQKPILLLDDVFSELDGLRRRALTTYLQTHQTFITTTDADIVAAQLEGATIIPLSWTSRP